MTAVAIVLLVAALLAGCVGAPDVPGSVDCRTDSVITNFWDEKVEWKNATSDALLNTVPAWTRVRLEVSFHLDCPGTVSLAVIGDAPLTVDPLLSVLEERTLQPGTQRLSGLFETGPDVLDGYVPALLFNGTKQWEGMGYPPRLHLTEPFGLGTIADVQWLVGGQPVTSVKEGDHVEMRVAIQAESGDFRDRVNLTVRRDVADAADTDQAPATAFVIDIRNATTTTKSVAFVASGDASVRGYYLYALSQGNWWWNMGVGPTPKLLFEQQDEPPRLALAH